MTAHHGRRPATQETIPHQPIAPIDGGDIDIADLLNHDLDVLDLLGRGIAELSAQAAWRRTAERLDFAERLLGAFFDLQLEHAMALGERVCRRRESSAARYVTAASQALHEKCMAINALGRDALAGDYARLRPGGRDAFSTMSLPCLAALISPQRWLDMEARLRAEGLSGSDHAMRTARWIARGLDIDHAIEKVRHDVGRSRRAASRTSARPSRISA